MNTETEEYFFSVLFAAYECLDLFNLLYYIWNRFREERENLKVMIQT